MNDTNLAVVERKDLPEFIVSIDEAKNRYNMLQRFVKHAMKEHSDYGVVPGTDKPTLLKPGAEKLANIYGLYSEVDIIEKIEDWDKPFFNYIAKAILYNKRTGLKEAEGIGSCNSMESKYRYRWVFESELTEEEKDDKDNLKRKEIFSKKQNRKYVMYRVLNEDIYSQVNTLQKMASKRAYVDAVLKATRTSDLFTQDLEDIEDNYRPVKTEKKKDKNKKQILKGIAELRDTIGMEKDELTDVVKERFKKTDPSKLSMDELIEIKDFLEVKLHDAIDGDEEQEEEDNG